ncbi:MAG TPA: polyphenol oxidase family protein [Candidatus Paceibacterota bacterium]
MRFFEEQKDDVVALMSELTDNAMGSSTNNGPDGSDIFKRNRIRFLNRYGLQAENMIMGGFVHGAEAKVVERARYNGRVPNTDILITSERLTILAGASADCFIIFAYFPGWLNIRTPGKSVIGLAHAGWRGITGGVVSKLISGMKSQGADPSNLEISITPGIGDCCFTVKEDENGIKNFNSCIDFCWRDERGQYHVNLKGILRHQLLTWGVSQKRLNSSEDCTVCEKNKGKYFSWRRDRRPGHQMLSLISLRG